MTFKENYQTVYNKIEPNSSLIQKTRESMKRERVSYKRQILSKLYVAGAIAACLAVSIVAAIIANGGIKTDRIADQNQAITDPFIDQSELLTSETFIPTAEDITKTSSPEEAKAELEADKSMGKAPIRLSEEEAYANETYGRFLPRKLLSGFQFESASIYNSGQTDESMGFLYCRNYNDIRVSVRKYQECDETSLVYVNDEDRYDITKYEIPFADTIPEELRDTMYNPIFLSEEFTENIISRRIVTIDDAGEGTHQSVVFALKCGEYIVEYSVKSKSMDGVYEMVLSANYFK